MNINSIKQFLKPTRKKILITLIFSLITTESWVIYSPGSLFYLMPSSYNGEISIHNEGFPLKYLRTVYYKFAGIENKSLNRPAFMETIFSVGTIAKSRRITDYLNFIIDIAFWYFISCFLIFAWNIKVRKPTV